MQLAGNKSHWFLFAQLSQPFWSYHSLKYRIKVRERSLFWHHHSHTICHYPPPMESNGNVHLTILKDVKSTMDVIFIPHAIHGNNCKNTVPCTLCSSGLFLPILLLSFPGCFLPCYKFAISYYSPSQLRWLINSIMSRFIYQDMNALLLQSPMAKRLSPLHVHYVLYYCLDVLTIFQTTWHPHPKLHKWTPMLRRKHAVSLALLHSRRTLQTHSPNYPANIWINSPKLQWAISNSSHTWQVPFTPKVASKLRMFQQYHLYWSLMICASGLIERVIHLPANERRSIYWPWGRWEHLSRDAG